MRKLHAIVCLAAIVLVCSERVIAEPAPGTRLTADLDERIDPETTVLWTAALQIAWDELGAWAGGPILLSTTSPPATTLAMSRFPRSWAGPADLVAQAGKMSDGLLETIERELNEKFPGVEPQGLASLRLLPPDAVAAFAFLRKQLRFGHPFEECPLQFHTTDAHRAAHVAGFGIARFDEDNDAHRIMADQIRILDHHAIRQVALLLDGVERPMADATMPIDDVPESLVIELVTDSSDDRLILAAIEPGRTLRQTIAVAMHYVREPTTSDVNVAQLAEEVQSAMAEAEDDSGQLLAALRKLTGSNRLLDNESFLMPVLTVEVSERYGQLQGPVTVDGQGAALPRIDLAWQHLRFNLDHTGVEMQATAALVFFGGPAFLPRAFKFDRPFLIMLLRKGGAWPYFAAWIGNTDMMSILTDPEWIENDRDSPDEDWPFPLFGEDDDANG